jgi:hypothetical protein
MTTATTRTPARRAATALLAVALAGTLTACTADDGAPSAGASPSASPPPSTATTPSAPASDDPAAGPATPTDVPADVMLPAAVFDASTEAFSEATDIEPWRLPGSCGDAPAPAGASGMRLHAHGDGEAETVVGIHQVAAFGTVDDAVAAATALVEALGGCTDTTGSGTTYGVEPVAVGAQGHGLATWYYGAQGGGDGMGTYLVVTRRGNAVTLVSGEGGERTVGGARTQTVAQAQQAWERLCGFEVAGC